MHEQQRSQSAHGGQHDLGAGDGARADPATAARRQGGPGDRRGTRSARIPRPCRPCEGDRGGRAPRSCRACPPCSTATFLRSTHGRTGRQARALVREAMELDRFSTVFDAFAKGRVSVDQAQGILAGLEQLPADLPSAASDTAQTMMVEFADQFDPDDLRRMSRAIWERLDPDGFDSADAARLEAEQRSAEQHRCLSIVPDGCGSMIIAGSVPLADGEQLRVLVDAHAQRRRSTQDHRADQSGRPAYRTCCGSAVLRRTTRRARGTPTRL
ncbi:hypothetical protein CGZ96_07100 [Enemella evansiae]|nr:hypothetical protein CGZ96_07100 [Enemella evansiae]